MAPTAERTHYTVLGVSPGAGAEEIRRAHRQLARVLHPDRQAGATAAERQLAERRMREVNAAWTVLSDPARRTDYDRSLRAARSSAEPGTSRPPSGTTRSDGAPPRSAAPEDAVDPDAAYARARLDELDPDEPELTSAHVWLLRRGPIVLALLVAGALFVMTAYAGGAGDDDAEGQPPRTSAVPEDCVRLTDGRTAVRTQCTQANDGRIVTEVAQPLDCPDRTTYVVLGGTITCVTTDPSVQSNTSPSTGG